MPARAAKNNPSGAANFVAYWVEVSNYAARSGDVTDLSSISAKTCGGCQTYIRLYQETYAKGGYFKGSDWKISNVEVEAGKSEHLVFAHVDAPVGEFKRTAASKVKHGNAEDSDLVFGVTWTGSSWRMTQLGLESELAR
jgi:hypothetical protein